MTGDSLKDVYNSIEPFIWYGIAVLVVPALRQHAAMRYRAALAAALAIFGTSDFFESEAWWTPWWLLGWKASSLSAIAVLGLTILRRRENSVKPS